jgi:predicted amidohydrolase YtcJ
MSKKADLVVYGNIHTVPKAQAVAILDGKFIYVGEKAGVKDFIGEQTQMVHYDQSILLPGPGGIAVGNQANLVVLDENITTFDPLDLANAKVLRTMTSGKWLVINEKN